MFTKLTVHIYSYWRFNYSNIVKILNSPISHYHFVKKKTASLGFDLIVWCKKKKKNIRVEYKITQKIIAEIAEEP